MMPNGAPVFLGHFERERKRERVKVQWIKKSYKQKKTPHRLLFFQRVPLPRSLSFSNVKAWKKMRRIWPKESRKEKQKELVTIQPKRKNRNLLSQPFEKKKCPCCNTSHQLTDIDVSNMSLGYINFLSFVIPSHCLVGFRRQQRIRLRQYFA